MVESPRIVPALLAAAILTAGVSASKAEMIIDQEFSAGGLVRYDSGLYGFGQSFTPTLDAIDFATLTLSDKGRGNGKGASFHVNLRRGDVEGAILATSSIVSLADSFGGEVRFDFLNTISLTPGELYTINLEYDNRDETFGVEASSSNGYSGGQAFAINVGRDYDFSFSEGINAVPEPASLTLALIGGAVGLIGYARRKRLT